MTDTTTETTPGEDTSTEETATETGEETTEVVTPAEETGAENEPNEDELPEWARERLTKANSEAANYRVRAKTAEKQLEDALTTAKTVEEMQTAVEQFKAENSKLTREVLVSSVAREYKLPDELASVLQGEDEVALKAHAEVLKKFVPAKRAKLDDLSGGLSPDESGDTFDPVKAGREARRNRHR